MKTLPDPSGFFKHFDHPSSFSDQSWSSFYRRDRGIAVSAPQIDIRPLSDQYPSDLWVVINGGLHQSGFATCVLSIHVRFILQE